jgi:RNA polymerase sigma-70 factor (ECF subfamily)
MRKKYKINLQELGKKLKEIDSEKYPKEANLLYSQLYECLSIPLKQHCSKKFKGYDSSYLVHIEIVNDAVASTFFKVYKNIEMYDTNRRFTTWIYRIAQYELYKILEARKDKLISEIKENPPDFYCTYSKDPTPNKDRATHLHSLYSLTVVQDHSHFDGTIEIPVLKKQVLDEIVKHLPEDFQELYNDKFIFKMKEQDIARHQNININTIKSRIRRLRSDLNYMYKINLERKLVEHENRKTC